MEPSVSQSLELIQISYSVSQCRFTCSLSAHHCDHPCQDTRHMHHNDHRWLYRTIEMLFMKKIIFWIRKSSGDMRKAQTLLPEDRLNAPSLWWSFKLVILCTIIDFMWNMLCTSNTQCSNNSSEAHLLCYVQGLLDVTTWSTRSKDCYNHLF